MGLLQNKVVLITGGARGQGRAHAVTCAHEGANVVVFDAPGQLSAVPYAMGTRAELDETVTLVEKEGRRAVAVTGDVRSQADLDGAVAVALEEFGTVDILIANAGVWFISNFWELSEDQREQAIETNLGGASRSAKAVDTSSCPDTTTTRSRTDARPRARIHPLGSDQLHLGCGSGRPQHLRPRGPGERGEHARPPRPQRLLPNGGGLHPHRHPVLRPSTLAEATRGSEQLRRV